MANLLQAGAVIEGGAYLLNGTCVEQLRRVLSTPYSDLPTAEKNAALKEADRLLDVLLRSLETLSKGSSGGATNSRVHDSPGAAPAESNTTG
jgi:hypothetical protein